MSRFISLAILSGIALICSAQVSPARSDGHRGGIPMFRALDEVRATDGTGNNVENPERGSAGQPLNRLTAPAYEDGIGEPSGVDRPGPRAVSNAVATQAESQPNSARVSDLFWQWGQFLDHDIDLTPVLDPPEAFDVPVPLGDPFFDPFETGTQVIPLERSFFVLVEGVREQVNEITAFIDASNVYGSNDERARELRTLDGTGRLKTSAGDLLPFNVNGFPNAPVDDDPTFFLAGDFRANEQVGLTALHTLFVREHNYWAERIATRSPRSAPRRGSSNRNNRRVRRGESRRESAPPLTGDEIYELARAIVGAEMQVITYSEFLPLLLGPDALSSYDGYDPEVDPGISNEFATAAYRFGHSMLSDTLRRLDRRGRTIPQGDLSLADAFFNPAAIVDSGIEPLLRGLARQRAQELDPFVVDGVRNFLFGPPGAGGLDLASLNIQRGRDHGLDSYNGIREQLGLEPRTTFDEISTDEEIVARLESVYPSVDVIDLWVGGLAEDPVEGALVGETFRAILSQQFEALRDGDRFWYENQLSPELIRLVEKTTLSRVIRRNTTIRRTGPRSFISAD